MTEARLRLSSYIFEHPEITVNSELISNLGDLAQPSVSERAEKIFRMVAKMHPSIGQVIDLPWGSWDTAFLNSLNGVSQSHEKGRVAYFMPLMACSWSTQIREITYLLSEVIVKEHGWLQQDGYQFQITPRGWAQLGSPSGSGLSRKAFVAMSFRPDLLPFYEQVIHRAIEQTQHIPLRIDRKEHVNRIDDEIIASIKGSRFAVCDFTDHKNGVYFEAGFALGFGIPVIWVCKASDLGSSHFDTRQYNAVTWDDHALEDAARRLEIRIRAVVGDFPRHLL
jgi:nucleoside 2-deoxyribosyltransferase